MKTRLLLVVLAVIAVAAPAAAQELQPGGTFVDDDGNTHEGMIEAIAAEGITRGCDAEAAGLYCPSDPVMRAQMASFLQRAVGFADSNEDAFSDDDGSVHEDAINAIAAAGVTLGCAEGLFCPTDAVRRDQMASFLTRAYQLPPSSVDHFGDDEGNTHEGAINAVAAAGITEGCEVGLFCPRSPVDRDQMASFLGRAEGLDPITPPARRIAYREGDETGDECSLVVSHIRLTEAACLYGGVTWSPDAGRIAFTRGDFDIWVIDRDGDNLTQLTSGLGLDAFPAWSPDGEQIAFMRFDGEGFTGSLYVMDANGSDERLLAASSDESAISMPDWSPDGSQIAVNGVGDDGQSGIYVVDSVSGDITLVINGPGGGPSWSPSGDRILSSRVVEQTSVITVFDADGSNLEDLTGSDLNAFDPSWSGDGTQIVFVTHAPGETEGPFNLWIMEADGSGMFPYTYGDAQPRFPDWASHGATITSG